MPLKGLWNNLWGLKLSWNRFYTSALRTKRFFNFSELSIKIYTGRRNENKIISGNTSRVI